MIKLNLNLRRIFPLLIFLFMTLSGCNEDSTLITDQQGKYKIAFVSYLNENNIGILVMNSDGSNQQRLTDDTLKCFYPEWSHDGKMIVYIQKSSVSGHEVWSMNSDGSNKKILSTDAGDDWDERAVWSPDGNKIVFRGSQIKDLGGFIVIVGGIFIINTDGTNQQFLSDGSSPSWSKDGTKILFLADDFANHRQVFTMNADGSNKIQLTSEDVNKRYPVFSPDGLRIAYTQGDGDYEIYIMNSDSTNKQRLTNEPGDDIMPNWNPAGTQIVFFSNRAGNSEVYIMNPDGTDQRRLTNGANVSLSFPSWAPTWMKILFSSGGINVIILMVRINRTLQQDLICIRFGHR